MINLADFKAWLVAEGITTPIAIGPMNQPETPHNVYAIWETGRIGLTTEDVFDQPTFQCLTRGASGKIARDLAEAFDNKMLSSRNFDLNGKFVLQIRNISGPFNLGEDNYGDASGQQARTEFTANYYLVIAR